MDKNVKTHRTSIFLASEQNRGIYNKFFESTTTFLVCRKFSKWPKLGIKREQKSWNFFHFLNGISIRSSSDRSDASNTLGAKKNCPEWDYYPEPIAQQQQHCAEKWNAMKKGATEIRNKTQKHGKFNENDEPQAKKIHINAPKQGIRTR